MHCKMMIIVQITFMFPMQINHYMQFIRLCCNNALYRCKEIKQQSPTMVKAWKKLLTPNFFNPCKINHSMLQCLGKFSSIFSTSFVSCQHSRHSRISSGSRKQSIFYSLLEPSNINIWVLLKITIFYQSTFSKFFFKVQNKNLQENPTNIRIKYDCCFL